jgi:LPS sulfotransferase NodH
MKRYLILAEPRTGSHRVLRLIRQHFELQGYDKISLQEWFRESNVLFNDEEKLNYFLDSKNADEFHVAKILLHQLVNYTQEQISQILNSYDYVIHLNRLDIFDQCLSFCIAHTLQLQGKSRWVSNDPVDSHIDSIKILKRSVEIFFKTKKDTAQVMSKVLTRDVMELSYERLCEMSPDDVISHFEISPKIALGVHDQTIKFETYDEKINKISNVDDVRSWFDYYLQNGV